jgi:hypothetical protein
MNKIIRVLIIIMIAMAAGITYERYVVDTEFGSSSLLAVALLLFAALVLTVTLLSFGTRFHEIVTRVWLVVVSVAVTFAVVDLVAGALLVKRLSPRGASDKIRHHKLVPDTDSRFEQPEFSYIQHVNNLGLRGKDTSLKKAPGHYRVLMLGDSFTMGKGVEENQTFSALVESLLNRRGGCGAVAFEVLNGGVDSYTPLLSYLQLTGDLAPLDVDLVLLNLDPSDLLQEEAYRKEAVYDQTGEIVAVPGVERPALWNQRIRSWIDQHTYFTRLMLFHVNQWMGHRDYSVQGVVTRATQELLGYTLEGDNVDREKQWNYIFESIAKIKANVEKRSAAFALVIYPWGHQVSDREWISGRDNFIPRGAVVSDRYLDTIYRRSKQLGIELLDVFPEIRAYKGEAPLYFKYDIHWTAEGHKVMASALGKYLIEKHLAPSCGLN